MTCRIAENPPLMELAESLGVLPSCHSFRTRCIHGHSAREGTAALAAAGAAFGYCQALFQPSESPRAHTERVRRMLDAIGAPWSNSHELFWGYRGNNTAQGFVDAAIEPLAGSGRVPVVISSLNPAEDEPVISSIITSRPPILPGESVLLRVVLRTDASVHATARLIRALLDQSERSRAMPRWWPLLQGEITSAQWSLLAHELGTAWRYVNVAINPFTPPDVFAVVRQQVTVAQVPIGLAEGMSEDGHVRLAPGMKTSGASDGAEYSLPTYFERIASSGLLPTVIVLGPTLPQWDDEVNLGRLGRLLPILQRGCDILWAHLDRPSREMAWGLQA